LNSLVDAVSEIAGPVVQWSGGDRFFSRGEYPNGNPRKLTAG